MQSSCNFNFDFIVRNNLRNLKLSSAADTDTDTSVSVVCDDNTVLELIVVELLVLDGPLLILSSPFIPPPIVLLSIDSFRSFEFEFEFELYPAKGFH